MLGCDQMNTLIYALPPCELLEQVKLAKPKRTGGLLGLVERLVAEEASVVHGSFIALT